MCSCLNDDNNITELCVLRAAILNRSSEGYRFIELTVHQRLIHAWQLDLHVAKQRKKQALVKCSCERDRTTLKRYHNSSSSDVLWTQAL